MERLTFEGNFCDIAKCSNTPGGSFCEDRRCSQREVWERLKAYEDAIQFDDLLRAAELVKADDDGRCVVLSCNKGDQLCIWNNKYLVRAVTLEGNDYAIICQGGIMISKSQFESCNGKVITRAELLSRNDDYPCRDHECYDRGNFHVGCESCPQFKNIVRPVPEKGDLNGSLDSKKAEGSLRGSPG